MMGRAIGSVFDSDWWGAQNECIIVIGEGYCFSV